MKVANLPISVNMEKISAFCHKRGIKRLRLFGSVLRDDFDSRSSDIDVLAEFKDHALDNVGFDYFGYETELSEILQRKVDFCSNLIPSLKENVDKNSLIIYESS
ncbi:MAG: nucleotidyltransferase domain-containing protein [Verrucomicrobiota bacterium]